MTLSEWQVPYQALCRTWNKTPNAQQAEAYFDVLRNYALSAVEQAIVAANGEAAYMPQPSKIREHCQHIVKGAVYHEPECQICGGNLWIDGPDVTACGRTYHTVKGCPKCRVTA